MNCYLSRRQVISEVSHVYIVLIVCFQWPFEHHFDVGGWIGGQI